MRDFLEKRVQLNMSRLLRRRCQLEKPPANEITDPLAFTVCKVELRGEAIVLGLWSTIIGKTEGERSATR